MALKMHFCFLAITNVGEWELPETEVDSEVFLVLAFEMFWL